MRKWLALFVAALLITGCAKEASPPAEKEPETIAERLFGPGDPRAKVSRELADPASAWWQDLQDPADGPAHIKQAPAVRTHLTYNPEERLLTGETGIIFMNTDQRPVSQVYVGAIARLLGDVATANERWSFSDLRIDGKAVAYREEGGNAVVTLDEPLKTGGAALITFAFTARLPVRSSAQQLGGVWSYGVDSARATGLTEALPRIGTDLQLKDAKAGLVTDAGLVVSDLRLTLPAGWRAISAGSVVGTEQLADGRLQYHIASAGSEFQLFVTDAMEQVSRQAQGVRLVVHYRKEQQAGAEALLAAMEKLLAAHAENLGPYPLREAEILPVDGAVGYGATWKAGLIHLNEQYFRVLTADQARGSIQTLSHELAHAWWGLLARPDRARSPWWDEGITEASSIAAVERVYGAEAAQAMREQNVLAYQKKRLSGMPDMAPGEPLLDPAKLAQYQAMRYEKPALFYEKVRASTGDEAFFAGLRRYIDKGRSTARADRGPVEELLGAPGVAELYQRWMLETHGDEDIGR
jgi:hypothetical protein